jgi:hypothetical protein
MMIALRAYLATVRSSLEWREVGHGMLIGAALGLALMGSGWVLMRALEWMVGLALAVMP